MNKVYLLWYGVYDNCEYDSMSNCDIIGVFSTKEKATQAMNDKFEKILKYIKEDTYDELDNIERSEDKIEYEYKSGFPESGELYIKEQELDVLFW